MKQKLFLLLIGIIIISPIWADWDPADPFPFSHHLSDLELEQKADIERNFIETDPPVGPVRPIAEWEPMKAVMIRYPFGIPLDLIEAMAENNPIICIVTSSQQNSASNAMQNAGVNMEHVSFMNYSTETYWTRDYGPWFVAYGEDEIGVINFKYNRPRPTDDDIPMHYADENGLEWFGMNVEHTGGNYMTDGYYQAVSTDLVYDENDLSAAEIREKFASYLGVTDFHITPDPLGDYIKHVDCWAKYLDVDKILISRVPASHTQYDEYEAVTAYFAGLTSSYGTPMQVFRVDIPGNNQVTPFTNSLILNGQVFVPVTGTSYDAAALEVYETAMPGYEIIAVNPGAQGWLNTDALHCRTHEIADDEMLYIAHQPVINAEVNEPITVEASFIAYSDAELLTDELIVSYQIDGGEFTELVMENVSDNNYIATLPAQAALTEIGYYISAADQAGKTAHHPYIGAADPHTFLVGTPQIALSANQLELTVAAGTMAETDFTISNPGELPLTYNISYSAQSADRETHEYEIADSPAANAYNSNTYTENNWHDFSIAESGTISTLSLNYAWQTDSYPDEGSFWLESPAGTTATVASGQTSGNYNLDLAQFNGEEMQGDWKIWIQDSYGDGGHQASNITLSINSLSAEEDWLTISPLSGTIAAGEANQITAEINASELADGAYLGTVIIENNSPGESTELVEIALTVGNVSADSQQLALTKLHHNYPNPFNPTTTISFNLGSGDNATELTIYNLKGQKITQLLNEQLPAGKHSVVWDGTDASGSSVASGVYFYKLSNGDFVDNKKMILLK
ncbi:MAG: agmatine deiminase family protein [Candidatus Cloacimonadales bacterium]